MYSRKPALALFLLCFFAMLLAFPPHVMAESQTYDDTTEEAYTVSEYYSSEFATDNSPNNVTEQSNADLSPFDINGICDETSDFAVNTSDQYQKSNGEKIPEIVDIAVGICSEIFTIFLAIWGMRTIKPIKEKAQTATFSFWSQLTVRLTIIKSFLTQDYRLLDNLYSSELSNQIGTGLSPARSRIDEFKAIVTDTLKFMNETSDQMPAYQGWSEDYTLLLGYLEDMIVYDISDSSNYFKFTNQQTDTARYNYCQRICDTIDRICNGIQVKQQEVEKSICRKRKS